MRSFLTQLAEKIVENSETPLEQTVVVVPNKRAKRELLRELAFHFSKPVFAPNIISVNEFIESLSSLKKIDYDELLMRLFTIYQKKNVVETDNSASLQTFFAWAPLFLHDINEIDLHLADAKVIFSNLSEIKVLETSFGKEDLTEMQRKYLLFYTQLADLYADFTATLYADNVGYEGMIYRDAVDVFSFNHKGHKEGTKDTSINFCELSENFCDPCGKIFTAARYIFAGLNAVTPSELELLHYFYVHKKAEFYFDIDTFYDEKYGVFVEEIRQKLRIPEIPKSNDYKNIHKQLSCTGAPGRTAQVYQAIEILNTIERQQGNLNNTVLALADETMLLPFVHAYNINHANITMGYPLRATFAAQQLQQLIDTEKLNNRLQKPVYDLKTQGFAFLQYLKIEMQKFENEDTNSENSYSQIVALIDEVTAFLMKFFPETPALNFDLVDYFLQEKLNATTIPFSGNEHEGLQVMGLLETRMLDFKNVIILTMNEGVLPKSKAAPSLLLYDIKKHFGISTHRRTDTIFGYHFFRLLQRAENVSLIYDNETSNNPSEKSRFIEQLEFERKKQSLQESIEISYNQFTQRFALLDDETPICITKTKSVMEKLTNFAFSSSSLNTYINCPLQFYLRFIEKIEIPAVFDENNASATVGTVIHAVLEEIFIQLKQKTVHFSTLLSEYVENIDNMLLRTFKKQPEIGDMDIFQGKLFLTYEIVKKSILDYLKVIREEWNKYEYQIIGIEIPLNVEVDLGDKPVRLTGKIDRIEIRDNKVTILDYKTGKVDAGKLKCNVENIEDIFTKPEYAKLFQLMCYAFLYQNSNDLSLVPSAEIQCGIIAFHELYQQNENYICYAEIDKQSILTREFLQPFETHLKQLFSAILDEKSAFYQTENRENCKYCDYSIICNK